MSCYSVESGISTCTVKYDFHMSCYSDESGTKRPTKLLIITSLILL